MTRTVVRTARILSVVLCFLLPGSTRAQENSPASDSPDDFAVVRPFITSTTCVVMKIDVHRLDLPKLDSGVESLPPQARTGLDELSKRWSGFIEPIRELVGERPVFATIGIPISKSRVPIHFFVKASSEENSKRLAAFLKERFDVDTRVRDGYVVASPKSVGGAAAQDGYADERRAAALGEAVDAAFASVADYPLRMILLPPDYLWRALNELSPELPPQLGGGRSSVITDGVRWAAVGVDPAAIRARVVVRSASDQSARALAEHLPVMLRSLHDAVKPRSETGVIPDQLALTLIGWIKPRVENEQVTIQLDGSGQTNMSAIIGALRAMEAQAVGGISQQRLKQIMIALHNYHDRHGMLPPDDKFRDEDGKHGLSWRVHILPYVGQEELFRQFRLDEPWDSPHNMPLIEKMPDVFASGVGTVVPDADRKIGYTTFLAPAGENTVFAGDHSTKLSQVVDGTSNTVAVVEVSPEKAVPWTAPDDYQFDPSDPLSGVLLDGEGRWTTAFMDASVHRLRGDMPTEVVLRLFQMNDRQPIELEQLR